MILTIREYIHDIFFYHELVYILKVG